MREASLQSSLLSIRLYNKVTVSYSSPASIEEIVSAFESIQVFGCEESLDTRELIFYVPEEKTDTLNDFLSSLHQAGTISDYSCVPFEDQQWQDEWKKYVKPVLIKPYYIHPPDYPDMEDMLNIVVNPGNAFGSGTHETTQLVLQIMAGQDFSGKHVLDIGCGSGILSFAAAKSGAAKVLSVDIDQDIRENFTENYAASLPGDQIIELAIGDMNKMSIPLLYDWLLVNMLPQNFEFIKNVPASIMVSGQKMVYSGFLTKDQAEVFDTYFSADFELLSQFSHHEWCAFILVRK